MLAPEGHVPERNRSSSEAIRGVLAPEGHVPERKLGLRKALRARKGSELLQLFLGSRIRLAAKHFGERVDRLHGERHLSREGDLCMRTEAEQARLLLAQTMMREAIQYNQRQSAEAKQARLLLA